MQVVPRAFYWRRYPIPTVPTNHRRAQILPITHLNVVITTGMVRLQTEQRKPAKQKTASIKISSFIYALFCPVFHDFISLFLKKKRKKNFRSSFFNQNFIKRQYIEVLVDYSQKCPIPTRHCDCRPLLQDTNPIKTLKTLKVVRPIIQKSQSLMVGIAFLCE